MLASSAGAAAPKPPPRRPRSGSVDTAVPLVLYLRVWANSAVVAAESTTRNDAAQFGSAHDAATTTAERNVTTGLSADQELLVDALVLEVPTGRLAAAGLPSARAALHRARIARIRRELFVLEVERARRLAMLNATLQKVATVASQLLTASEAAAAAALAGAGPGAASDAESPFAALANAASKFGLLPRSSKALNAGALASPSSTGSIADVAASKTGPRSSPSNSVFYFPSSSPSPGQPFDQPSSSAAAEESGMDASSGSLDKTDKLSLDKLSLDKVSVDKLPLTTTPPGQSPAPVLMMVPHVTSPLVEQLLTLSRAGDAATLSARLQQQYGMAGALQHSQQLLQQLGNPLAVVPQLSQEQVAVLRFQRWQMDSPLVSEFLLLHGLDPSDLVDDPLVQARGLASRPSRNFAHLSTSTHGQTAALSSHSRHARVASMTRMMIHGSSRSHENEGGVAEASVNGAGDASLDAPTREVRVCREHLLQYFCGLGRVNDSIRNRARESLYSAIQSIADDQTLQQQSSEDAAAVAAPSVFSSDIAHTVTLSIGSVDLPAPRDTFPSLVGSFAWMEARLYYGSTLLNQPGTAFATSAQKVTAFADRLLFHNFKIDFGVALHSVPRGTRIQLTLVSAPRAPTVAAVVASRITSAGDATATNNNSNMAAQSTSAFSSSSASTSAGGVPRLATVTPVLSTTSRVVAWANIALVDCEANVAQGQLHVRLWDGMQPSLYGTTSTTRSPLAATAHVALQAFSHKIFFVDPWSSKDPPSPSQARKQRRAHPAIRRGTVSVATSAEEAAAKPFRHSDSADALLLLQQTSSLPSGEDEKEASTTSLPSESHSSESHECDGDAATVSDTVAAPEPHTNSEVPSSSPSPLPSSSTAATSKDPARRRLGNAESSRLSTDHDVIDKLIAVDWLNSAAARVAMQQISSTPTLQSPTAALRLLGGAFPDSTVRAFAVSCLHRVSDGEFVEYSMQLVQALKFENYHDSPLARHLLERALSDDRIGQRVFWYLRSEAKLPTFRERFSLLLEVFIALLDRNRLLRLVHQVDVHAELEYVAQAVKHVKAASRHALLHAMLSAMRLPPVFGLPIATTERTLGETFAAAQMPDSPVLSRAMSVSVTRTPSTRGGGGSHRPSVSSRPRPADIASSVSLGNSATLTGAAEASGPDFKMFCGLNVSGCKVLDSKKLPLWLSFKTTNPFAQPFYALLKCGDDVRQDMLTLQLIRLMDRLWKANNLDLRLITYDCIATDVSGAGVGLIQAVRDATTLSAIQKLVAGSAAVFKENTISVWLRQQNPIEEDYIAAVDNFTLSCAGYCVATYVLGIGDRHNDNIMLKSDGHIFHIDFGHILGNIKRKFGIKRERTPFILTSGFANVMGGSGKDNGQFTKFQVYSCHAFMILRQNAALFINLLLLMLGSGLPELRSEDDIAYVKSALFLDQNDADALRSFQDLLAGVLKAEWSTQINWYIHNLKHA
ncbi:phosphoinositide-3-kinase [Capsaspora owczarzaki ATCC 30864]|uniref:Phosphoinositide-3-kinase n=1 Tax=Capsaspora owczarzaki (strain ATCC 30864) TaxID=595528 RepID=A0A0D2WNR9_CAPO3|nr:phosphoinositide-3-kinase [Capsaspora owczarzaki ATCC 30864]